MERLSDTAIEIINDLHTERLEYTSEYIPLIDSANKLAEYEDLEEQGLLLRLPCKVGDTLYHILACTTAEDFGKKYVSWFIVTHITINITKEVAIVGSDWRNREWRINSRGIGKTVFLTKEEAEAKLREMEEK